MSEDGDLILQQLKGLDPGLYYSCLFLPEEFRSDIATLWTFEAEITRIPDLVSEPMPGEIRIQWWRDLIKSGDNAGSGPLARNLMRIIDQYDLPRERFDMLLQAHIFDLYHDPMPDMGSFEGYLGETISAVFHSASLVMGADQNTELANTAGHAGMAVGIARLLKQIRKHRAKGQLFWPATVLQQNDLERQVWLDNPVSDAHLAVVKKMISEAVEHQQKCFASLNKLKPSVRRVFLPTQLVSPALRAIEKASFDVFARPAEPSQLRLLWSLLAASLRKSS